MPSLLTGAPRAFRNSLLLVAALSLGSRAAWLGLSTEKANVRSGPGMRAEVLWQVFIYTPFRSLGKKGNWIRVANLHGATGWIHATVLREMAAVIVRTKKANVRRSPGMDGEVIWRVDYGYPFKVIGRTGNWLQIEDEAQIQGWIHKDVVWGNKEIQEGTDPGV